MRRVRKFFSTFSLTCTNFWVSRTTTSDRRAGGARLRKSKIWKFRLGATRSSPFSTWFYGGKNGFDGGLRTGFECSSNPYRPFNAHGTIRPVEFFFQLFDRFSPVFRFCRPNRWKSLDFFCGLVLGEFFRVRRYQPRHCTRSGSTKTRFFNRASLGVPNPNS